MSELFTTSVELPDGAVVEHTVTIVSYLVEDGQRYVVATTGGANVASVLGVMELAKLSLAEEASS